MRASTKREIKAAGPDNKLEKPTSTLLLFDKETKNKRNKEKQKRNPEAYKLKQQNRKRLKRQKAA